MCKNNVIGKESKIEVKVNQDTQVISLTILNSGGATLPDNLVTDEELTAATQQAVAAANFYTDGKVGPRMYLYTWSDTSSINVVPGSYSFNMVDLNDSGYGPATAAQYVIQGGVLIRMLNEFDKADLISATEKGAALGVMPLDENGKAQSEFLPDSVLGNLKFAGTYNGSVIAANDNFPELNGQALPTSGYLGIYFIATADYGIYKVGDWTVHQGSGVYLKVDNSDAVSTVFGRLGNVVAIESDYDAFYPKLGITYMNPAWVGELAYNKISGTPTTVAASGLTDAVSSAGNRQISGLTTLGSGSIAPTHTATFPSVSTGAAYYNTVDQTTNYERVRTYWSGNIFNIYSENGGTGIQRALSFRGGGRVLNLGVNTGPTGFISLDMGTGSGSANVTGIAIMGTLSSSANSAIVYSAIPTVNQTGTAGYKCFFASPFQQATGSGAKLLIDVGTNSAANNGGTHTSKFNVDNNGRIMSAGVIEYTDNAAAIAAGLTAGMFYRTGEVLKVVH